MLGSDMLLSIRRMVALQDGVANVAPVKSELVSLYKFDEGTSCCLPAAESRSSSSRIVLGKSSSWHCWFFRSHLPSCWVSSERHRRAENSQVGEATRLRLRSFHLNLPNLILHDLVQLTRQVCSWILP